MIYIRVDREVVGRNCRNYLLGQLESEGGKGTRNGQWTPNPHAGQGIVVGCIKQRGGGFLSSVVTRAVPQSSWSLRSVTSESSH